MGQCAFQFATSGHCITGKQCHPITIGNNKFYLCSKQSSLFSFYVEPTRCLVSKCKSRWPFGSNYKKQFRLNKKSWYSGKTNISFSVDQREREVGIEIGVDLGEHLMRRPRVEWGSMRRVQ